MFDAKDQAAPEQENDLDSDGFEYGDEDQAEDTQMHDDQDSQDDSDSDGDSDEE